ncbi:potassium transporter TrkA [Streptomyces sp. SID10853]|uniref:NAD-binding protein n=1 Tax=Streptomyces sp. SID10853 TaxID=2706028 RepID=UPI0013C20DBF|nr:NAD-binding protein [Streptomyces sp. SID10853]NDZ80608.1 potassium transporter TrkA [Streptomyces sp. SID10853]
MIVCGDDGLAHRLAVELRGVYRETVTLVVPPAGAAGVPEHTQLTPVGRASALFGRMSRVVTGPSSGDRDAVADRLIEAAAPDDDVLLRAGAEEASALALVHQDDEVNIRAALAARRLNPRLRLVIRLYNRKLGQHLEELLDQAAAVSAPGMDRDEVDASTTVLSDADTAAPALAATVVAGTSKVVQADGLLLRAVERPPAVRPGAAGDPGLCTLALLSSTTGDPGGADGSDSSGEAGPQLLPDEASVQAASGRGTVVLEAVSYRGPDLSPSRLAGRGAPLAQVFSRRLRWSLFGIFASVLGLAVASWLTTGDPPVHAAYLTILDIFAIGDPAVGEPTSRQVIQMLSGLTGLLLLPVLVAAVLEGLGTFRTAAALRRPPRGLSGHVVLLGLGKVGSRVLARLRELDIPVVCVEADPEARGIALARRLRVPIVIGDVTTEGVLEAAKIQRARALLALTSADITNLEAALYARTVKPHLRVSMRLFDDAFASAVFRTLRAAHPQAVTRSRSVSTLAAPAFAAAMMGRQILGAMPVERRVLLFAAVDVAGHPLLEGRTLGQVFREGAWRILALDLADPDERRPDLSVPRSSYGDGGGDGDARKAELVWNLPQSYVLRPEDRVVIAGTRQGLADLLGRRQPRVPAES